MATAIETSFPNSAMRLSSAAFPWRPKRAENISWRTVSRLCSWKQLHMISSSWSSWSALILWNETSTGLIHCLGIHLQKIYIQVKILLEQEHFCLWAHEGWIPRLDLEFWSQPEEAVSQTAPGCRCKCPGGTAALWQHSAHPEATMTDECHPSQDPGYENEHPKCLSSLYSINKGYIFDSTHTDA